MKSSESSKIYSPSGKYIREGDSWRRNPWYIDSWDPHSGYFGIFLDILFILLVVGFGVYFLVRWLF